MPKNSALPVIVDREPLIICGKGHVMSSASGCCLALVLQDGPQNKQKKKKNITSVKFSTRCS